MWRRGTLALLLVGLGFAAVLAIGFVGANGGRSVAAGPGAPASGCQAHYAPIAACSVPQGASFSYPCGIDLTHATITWCTSTSPDLNPADWLSWFGCTILADGAALFQAILSSLVTFLVGVVNSVLQVFVGMENAVLGAVESAFSGVLAAINGAVLLVTSWVNAVSLNAGPFAPVLVALLTGALILVAVVGGYVAFIGLVAIGKTVFNLL